MIQDNTAEAMVQDNITRYVNNINELLESHNNMIKRDMHINLPSRAVHSESFYCDFLNVLMGWGLKNANIECPNAPGIDLIDTAKKVAVQVSLTCDHEKIQSSIDKFYKNWSKGSSGWHFYFVPLSDEVPHFKRDFSVPDGIKFEINTDVLTKERIMDLAMAPSPGELTVDRLKRVSSTLDRLMREQKEKDHDEVCNYLFGVLQVRRKDHPSFKLLENGDIDRRLFPGIEESKVMPAMGEKNGFVAPIWDLIEEEQKEGFRHIVIEGTGGIGKSVSLLSVTDRKELLERIPAIYIHMYDLVSDGKCDTITDYIDEYFKAYSTKIEHLASKSGKPRLMVLLDGLNEVAYCLQRELMKKIREWIISHQGVQLIIASRPIPGKRLEDILEREVSFIQLKQLEWSHVEQYLKSRHIPVPEEKSRIGETIKTPLFLTLYTKTAKLAGKTILGECELLVKEAVGPASLIWNYLQREALRQQTESDVISCVLSCELIAPYIAYRMEANHMYEAGEKNATKLVCEAVRSMKDSIDHERLPKHVSTAWEWFGKKTHSQDIPDVNWPTRVLDECGVFVPPVKKSEGVTDGYGKPEADYAFMHQNFRDCLAALHLVNAAEMADGELPKEWKKSIRHEVLEYAAELMDKPTAAKLWELNRLYKRYTGEKPKDNASTYMQLELNRLLGTPGDQLNFTGMDLRGMSLTNYMDSGHDLGLFGKLGLSNNTHIDRKVFEHTGHTDWVNCLAVFPDGHIVSGSDDNTIRIWDPDTGECLRTLKGHTNQVTCVAVLPDRHTVSGADDNMIRIWDPNTGECLQTMEGHADRVRCLAVLPDDRIVSGGSWDETIRVWDPDTGECLRTMEGHADRVRCLAVLPDGCIVSGSDDRTLRVWDSDTGECLRTLKGHTLEVECLAVLPDGRIVSGSWDKTLRVWDPDTGECLWMLEKHGLLVNCLAALPDGRIVSGSYDKTLRIWNLDTGECLRTLEGHIDWVSCVAALPNGLIVSGSWDETLRIWDPDSGKCLNVLEVTDADVSHMHLSNAIMDEDTIRILYQNMAQNHREFAKMYLKTGGNK